MIVTPTSLIILLVLVATAGFALGLGLGSEIFFQKSKKRRSRDLEEKADAYDSGYESGKRGRDNELRAEECREKIAGLERHRAVVSSRPNSGKYEESNKLRTLEQIDLELSVARSRLRLIESGQAVFEHNAYRQMADD